MSKNDIAKGITHAFYSYTFENYFDLILYKDFNFDWQYKSTNFFVFSKGKWKIKKDILYLNSAVDSNDVHVKLSFFDTDTLKSFRVSDTSNRAYKTKIQVPINLEQSLLSDSKIFINNDSTFCFPYFDTCIGNVKSINRIKVNFGNGYKTKWLTIDKENFSRLLIIAQINFSFDEYKSFRNYRLKFKHKTLESLDPW